jgi:hypothetical protein
VGRAVVLQCDAIVARERDVAAAALGMQRVGGLPRREGPLRRTTERQIVNCTPCFAASVSSFGMSGGPTGICSSIASKNGAAFAPGPVIYSIEPPPRPKVKACTVPLGTWISVPDSQAVVSAPQCTSTLPRST